MTSALIRLLRCAGCSAPFLFVYMYNKVRFSRCAFYSLEMIYRLVTWVICFDWSHSPIISLSWIGRNLIISNIYYSNFDKHHLKKAHRVQCTDPTPLAHDNFRRFSSNSPKFSVVIENAMGYTVSCKWLTKWSLRCPWVGKCKMLHFRNCT